jgi:hypothetical protein
LEETAVSCAEWEERVALWAGGDVEGSEAAGVEQHTADCAGCREFAAGIAADLAALRADPITAADLAAVRTRVLAEIEARRRPWWRGAWAWALAGAAAAVIAVLVRTPPPGPVPKPPLVAMAHPPAPYVERFTPARPASPRMIMRAALPGPAPAPKAEPLVIELLTDDPDVIIYWIASEGDNPK